MFSKKQCTALKVYFFIIDTITCYKLNYKINISTFYLYILMCIHIYNYIYILENRNFNITRENKFIKTCAIGQKQKSDR